MSDGTAAGYLHDPALWIGKVPPRGVGRKTDARDDVVLRAHLRSGLRAKAFRDGVFVFDFSDWKDDLPKPTGKDRSERAAARIDRRAVVLNTHIACLHTAMFRLGSTVAEKMLVTPRTMLRLSDLDARRYSTGDGRVRAMVDSAGRRASGWDDAVRFGRFRTPQPVRVRKKEVALSFQILDDVLRSRTPIQTGLLIQLALQACSAIEDHRYLQSLEAGWVVTERLLQVLWDTYLTQRGGSPRVGDEDAAAISPARRRHLKDPRAYPSAVIAEVLSLAGALPHGLHRRLVTVRRARDGWLNQARLPTRKDARRASSVATEMLWEAEGIDLSLEAADTVARER